MPMFSGWELKTVIKTPFLDIGSSCKRPFGHGFLVDGVPLYATYEWDTFSWSIGALSGDGCQTCMFFTPLYFAAEKGWFHNEQKVRRENIMKTSRKLQLQVPIHGHLAPDGVYWLQHPLGCPQPLPSRPSRWDPDGNQGSHGFSESVLMLFLRGFWTFLNGFWSCFSHVLVVFLSVFLHCERP